VIGTEIATEMIGEEMIETKVERGIRMTGDPVLRKKIGTTKTAETEKRGKERQMAIMGMAKRMGWTRTWEKEQETINLKTRKQQS
jgi:hypothetical protein